MIKLLFHVFLVKVNDLLEILYNLIKEWLLSVLCKFEDLLLFFRFHGLTIELLIAILNVITVFHVDVVLYFVDFLTKCSEATCNGVEFNKLRTIGWLINHEITSEDTDLHWLNLLSHLIIVTQSKLIEGLTNSHKPLQERIILKKMFQNWIDLIWLWCETWHEATNWMLLIMNLLVDMERIRWWEQTDWGVLVFNNIISGVLLLNQETIGCACLNHIFEESPPKRYFLHTFL